MDIPELTAVHGLLAGSLLVYGTLHGAVVVRVWDKHERYLMPMLLFVSPIGVGLCLLAALPFVGWEAVLTMAMALACGFTPISLIVWFAVLRRKDGLQ